MQTTNNEPSLGQLFSDLSKETTTLVHEEIALAKVELTQRVTKVSKDAAFIAAGVVLLYTGFLALVATVIIAIAYALPWWLSALIVTVVLLGLGAWLAYMGYDKLRKTQLAPQQTMNSLKEDVQWIKEQTT